MEGGRRLINEFSNKMWFVASLSRLLKKLTMGQPNGGQAITSINQNM